MNPRTLFGSKYIHKYSEPVPLPHTERLEKEDYVVGLHNQNWLSGQHGSRTRL